jgi:hypothetical protein
LVKIFAGENAMRKPFEPQMTIGTVPISKISFDIYCRHELVPILMSLKHIYSCEPALDEILDLIRNDVIGNSNDKLGCSGMGYWDILVLAAVRLGCNLDYDALHDLANNHIKLRDIMRISRFDDQRFSRTTIHDNISKLSPATIFRISDIIVDLGHKLFPKSIEKGAVFPVSRFVRLISSIKSISWKFHCLCTF